MKDIAICAEKLGKQYCLGRRQGPRKAFPARLTDAFKRFYPPHWRTFPNNTNRASETFWALENVSFEIERGDIVGIIGRNGAGKSTLLKVLSRITEPTTGYAEIHGRLSSLLEVGTGFHHELTGRENIYLNAAILGMKRREIDQRFDEIVAFAEIEKFVDTPVKHYSSGMYLRLAFAVAAHLEPNILLVDEVLAVGDVSFQKKCLGKMEDVAKEGRTVLFVSHNMGAIRSLCNRGIVLDQGRIVETGDVGKSLESYYRLIGALDHQASPSIDATVPSASRLGFVRLNGGAGNTVTQLQEFRVSTTLQIDRAIASFDVLCFLEDMQGRQIFRLRRASSDFGFRQVAAGEYTLSVTVPPLSLNPGLYSIYFKTILRSEKNSSQHVSDKFPLDIEGTSGHSDSLLNPAAQWHVRPAGLTDEPCPPSRRFNFELESIRP